MHEADSRGPETILAHRNAGLRSVVDRKHE
jgi:hypothetical protein